jgi:methyl-accepting chemotaxis protein
LKLNVRTKLLGGFLVVIALMIVIGVLAIARIGSISNQTHQLGGNVVPATENIGSIREAIFTYRLVQIRWATSLDAADRRRMADSLQSTPALFRDALAKGLALASDPTDRSNYEALDAAWNGYLQATDPPLKAAVLAGDARAAIDVIGGRTGADSFNVLREAVVAVGDYQRRESAANVTGAEDTASAARTIIIVLLAIATLIGIAVALLLSRAIVNGVRQMLTAARGIAQGDIEQTVEIRSRDELGETGEAFREMIAYLDETAVAARRIAAGDLEVEVKPKSERDALGTAFAAMSAELRDALGDRSCLEQLMARLESLSSHCMTELEHALAAAAQGDLTYEVAPVTTALQAEDGRDPGRLASTFNTMLERAQGSIEAYNAMRHRISAMLRQISTETQAVAAASQQMATTSEESGRAIGEIASAVGEVAAGAERQVRTVGEARELTEQVVVATRSSTENASETARAAEQAREVAEEGAKAITRATEGMQALEAVSAGVTEAMRGLGAKSDQIGGIVGTITGIAEQTNLLALNAAIEAARAGEQGRGFAVVAEEVRKLAEESQQAAASISTLVEEIQRDTGAAVQNVEAGGAEIEHGVTTVGEAREAFLRIGTSVEDMSGRVEQIASAIDEISQRATRMEENMAEVVSVAEQSSASTEQVSASTQQTSASTQEIAASAQELAKTAEQLEQLVGQFTLTR